MKDTESSDDWDLVPATERQKAKLRFFKVHFDRDLSKGEAAVLLDELAETATAEDDVRYRRWRDEQDAQEEAETETELRLCQYHDALEERDWLPQISKQELRLLIRQLDARYPHWETSNPDLLFNEVAERFHKKAPPARKPFPPPPPPRKRKSSKAGCLVATIILLIGVIWFIVEASK